MNIRQMLFLMEVINILYLFFKTIKFKPMAPCPKKFQTFITFPSSLSPLFITAFFVFWWDTGVEKSHLYTLIHIGRIDKQLRVVDMTWKMVKQVFSPLPPHLCSLQPGSSACMACSSNIPRRRKACK